MRGDVARHGTRRDFGYRAPVFDADARARWSEYRRAPLRRDLLDPLLAACDAARSSAAAALLAADTDAQRADALGPLLAHAVVAGHLRSLRARPINPRMVALLVAADMLGADEAALLLDLRSADERVLIASLVPRLSPAALWTVVDRLLAAPALMAHFDALTPALRRAAALDAPRTVALLRTPERAPDLAALLPHLAGDALTCAREHVLSSMLRRTALFDQLDLLRRALPALTDADLQPLRFRWRDLPPDLAARGLPAVRAWIDPHLRREWQRIAALADARARLDAWESRLDALGPLVTLDDARRWLAELVSALAVDPEQSFRLQVGIPAELADEAADLLAAALPAPALCEALVWLARPHGGRVAARAMRTIAATDELPDDRRRHLLGTLLPLLPPPERRRAAAAILADPARTSDDELRAAAHLEGERLRAAARDLLHAAPLAPPHASPALAPALAVAPLADLAAALAGDDRDVVLAGARRLADRGPAWIGLRALAPLLAPAEAARLADVALADPDLPPPARAALLPLLPAERQLPRLRRAAAELPPTPTRWHTLAELVAEVPGPRDGELLRDLHRELRALGALAPDEVVAFPPWARDVDLWREYARHMRAHPWRPYAGWLLGAAARELPDDERGPALDAALDEFAAIVATPTSPGNDAGPFVELADLLSEPQVRRALDLVERMRPHGWGSDLEHARLHLHLRLAALGRADEAAAAIADLADPGLRAWGSGALAGRLAIHGAAWPGVPVPEDSLSDPARRFDVLAGAAWSLADTPVPEDTFEALLALLPGIDPDLRDAAVRDLARLRGVPPARLAAVVRAHAEGEDRLALLIDLALAAPDLESARALADDALAGADDLSPADALEHVLRAHSLLAPPTLARWFARWLDAPADRPPLTDLRELPFAPALLSLGGPATVRAAAEALLAAVDLLS